MEEHDGLRAGPPGVPDETRSLPSGGGVVPPGVPSGGANDSAPPAETGSGKPETATKPGGALVESLVLVLIALLLALVLKTYVAEAYEVKGNSMRPTFDSGERVVVLKAFYEIERGDVVIFASREDPGKDLIKRVIGLPGDRLRIEGGRVWVNGERLAEDYLAEGALDDYPPERIITTVRPGEYYVLGDNRRDSHDSRRFHGVPAENLKGKVIVRWWPLAHVRTF